MNWDYARLSMAAKAHGGPENFVDYLLCKGFEIGRDSGIKTGRIQMLNVIGIAFVLGVATETITKKIQSYVSQQRNTRQMNDVKKELLREASECDNYSTLEETCLDTAGGDGE